MQKNKKQLLKKLKYRSSSVFSSLLDSSNTFRVSDLLPYDPVAKTGTRLKDGLYEVRLLLRVIMEVLHDLRAKKYVSFDSLVGENACQIRAFINVMIFSKGIDRSELSTKAEVALRCINKLIADRASLVASGASLAYVLKSYQINLRLSYIDVYLIRSFLLTRVKMQRPFNPDTPLVKREFTDYKEIKKIDYVGTMFSEKIIKKFREDISFDSALFIQELASDLDLPEFISEYISDRFLVFHQHWHCLPCFWFSFVLLLGAIKYKVPILLIGTQIASDKKYQIKKKTVMLFESDGNSYSAQKLTQNDQKRPAFICLGTCYGLSKELPELQAWNKQIAELGPVHIILAYAASHRQYPNGVEDQTDVQNDYFQFYKKNARKWGCELAHPHRYFLKHVYCDTIESAVKSMKEKKLTLFYDEYALWTKPSLPQRSQQ